MLHRTFVDPFDRPFCGRLVIASDARQLCGGSATGPDRIVTGSNGPPASIPHSQALTHRLRFAQSRDTYKLRLSAASENRGNLWEVKRLMGCLVG
jgi:hypothetical protein